MLKLFQPESWMSKLLTVSLGLLFPNQRPGLLRTGGWEPLERGRKREGGKEKSQGWGNLENLRNILGKREWNHCRKGMGSESQRYLKREVHTPCPSPPPRLYIFMASDPDWSHYVRTFQLKNHFYLFAICLLCTVCLTSCQESTGIFRCFKRHIIELL